MKRGSRRWKRLQQSKNRQLAKIRNQINDILHKQTTALVSTLHKRGVQTLVIGDLRDLRKRVNYGPTANQRIHQMVSGKVRWMLTYKSKMMGMEVVLKDERYTSKRVRHVKAVISPADVSISANVDLDTIVMV